MINKKIPLKWTLIAMILLTLGTTTASFGQANGSPKDHAAMVKEIGFAQGNFCGCFYHLVFTLHTTTKSHF